MGVFAIDVNKNYGCRLYTSAFYMWWLIYYNWFLCRIIIWIQCAYFSASNPSNCHNYQEIKVQEQVQRLGVGTIPRSMYIILQDDIVDTCKPGDDVAIWWVITITDLICYDYSNRSNVHPPTIFATILAWKMWGILTVVWNLCSHLLINHIPSTILSMYHLVTWNCWITDKLRVGDW